MKRDKMIWDDLYVLRSAQDVCVCGGGECLIFLGYDRLSQILPGRHTNRKQKIRATTKSASDIVK